MVHRREIDGQAVSFGNQGDLFKNAMTWFDHDTGSVWSQPTGEAILGPLTGARLELLPSSLARWDQWQEQFPDTTALDVGTSGSDRFSIEQMLVAAAVGDASVAVPFVELRDLGAVTTTISNEPVLFVADPMFDRWAVFSRNVDGVPLDLERRDGFVFDPDSGNRWNPSTGASLDGLDPLDRVSAFSVFPEDYPAFYPDGFVISQ